MGPGLGACHALKKYIIHICFSFLFLTLFTSFSIFWGGGGIKNTVEGQPPGPPPPPELYKYCPI